MEGKIDRLIKVDKFEDKLVDNFLSTAPMVYEETS